MVGGVRRATFADDTKIFSDVSKAGLAIQSTLENIEKWSNRWKLRISSKSATSHVLHNETHQYILFNESIDEVDVLEDLGILLSSDLKPEFHIHETIARASKRANFFIRATDCRIPSVFIHGYNALVAILALWF